jgi:hypothetical protein
MLTYRMLHLSRLRVTQVGSGSNHAVHQQRPKRLAWVGTGPSAYRAERLFVPECGLSRSSR